MKKSVMRLHKSQLPSLVRYNVIPNVKPTPNQFFRKAIYVQAGFTSFQVMCVGAAGGFSGRCVSNSDNITFESGPGGGGSIHYTGLLSELPDQVTIKVGPAGADGADTGDGDMAENGWEGGRSEFWHLVAEGGWGGWGGEVDRIGGGTAWVDAEGGDGGVCWSDFGGGTPNPGTGGPNNGSAGSVVVQGSLIKTAGGGGGQARTKINKTTQHVAGTGGAGASTNPDYVCVGESSVSNMGGPGGGVNVKPITGADEFYGSRVSGHNPAGIVILKLS